MQNTLADLSKYYKVPATRGTRVRREGKVGTITAHSRRGSYINVRFDGEKKSIAVHPLDVDYQTELGWQGYQTYLDAFNARIDKWNEQLAKG